MLNGEKKYKAEKLTATFKPRKGYVCHYVNLKCYLSLGLKLKKVNRALRFSQSPFLKPFIDHCTNLRKAATTPFEKSHYKLLANSTFGKTIENTRSYLQCRLANSEKKSADINSQINFSNMQIINPNLTVHFMKIKNVKLNKPIYAGMTILDRSKEFMANQYYKKILPLLKEYEVSVSFTDTDSFFLKVIMKVEEKSSIIMEKLKPIMDFANYPKDHPLYSNTKENMLGFFKDEMKGEDIKKFVGLRAKSYCYQCMQNKSQTKCKGIAKKYQKKLKFKAYEKCIKHICKYSLTQHTIRSKKHRISSISTHKLAISSFDDKRWLCPCGIHSLAYASIHIKKVKKSKLCPFCKKSQL